MHGTEISIDVRPAFFENDKIEKQQQHQQQLQTN